MSVLNIMSGLYMKTLVFRESISPLNVYIIKGTPRSLMLDTGMNYDYCRDFISQYLKELDISYTDLDVFITHNHPDHSGLAERLSDRGARIFMNPEEAGHRHDFLHCYLADARCQSESLRLAGITSGSHPGLYRAYRSDADDIYSHYERSERFPYTPVHPGEILEYGVYRFKAVPLPGHTYGQLGLEDAAHRLLFCGDQIMTTIYPIVATSALDSSLLRLYLESLTRLKDNYRGYTILPSHYEIITDVETIVNNTAIHYLNKCDIMKKVLESRKKPLTVMQVGLLAYGRIEETISRKGLWEFTSIIAKTFSCLEYLYEEGFVNRTEKNGVLYWSGRS